MLLRIAISALLVAGAVPALYRWCWMPHRCNQIEKAAELTTERTLEIGGGYTEAVRAREAAQRVVACIEHARTDVNLYMLAAANYRALGRFDEALAMYRAALRYDRRPELYFNIGETYLAMGNAEEANRFLVAAALVRTKHFEQIPLPARERALAEARKILESPPAGGYVLPN